MSFEDVPGAAVMRVSTDAFEALMDFATHEFSGQGEVKLEKARVADIALAVGFREGETAEHSGPTTPFNLNSLDKHNVIRPLIEQRHPDADGPELRDLVQAYLEGGAQRIAESIDDNSVWDYHQYMDEGDG